MQFGQSFRDGESSRAGRGMKQNAWWLGVFPALFQHKLTLKKLARNSSTYGHFFVTICRYSHRLILRDRDESFNSITGLNGSGKSNILDAICFVLGITNMQTVRAQNLQVGFNREWDLSYKQTHLGKPRNCELMAGLCMVQ